MQIARDLPFSGNIFLHLCFLPYQTWLCDMVASSGRHTCEKTVSIMKYCSILIDHHLKSLLILVTSSECSSQGQILHCSSGNLGCSSAEGRSSILNSGTKTAVLPEIE